MTKDYLMMSSDLGRLPRLVVLNSSAGAVKGEVQLMEALKRGEGRLYEIDASPAGLMLLLRLPLARALICSVRYSPS